MPTEKRDVIRDIDRLTDRVNGLEKRVRMLELDKENQAARDNMPPAKTSFGKKPV